MARTRNIKPGFFENDILAECEPLARIMFAGLWCHADRVGVLEDRPRKLKVAILPYDNCDPEALLTQLAERGFIVRYEVDGQRLIWIPTFEAHQNPHKEERSKGLALPPDKSGACVVQSTEPAPHKHESAVEGIRKKEEGGRYKVESRRAPGAKFTAPSVAEVAAYCAERKNGIDASLFVDHYTANGWTQGRGKPIRDWQAAVRTWEKNGLRPQPPPSRVATAEDGKRWNPVDGLGV